MAHDESQQHGDEGSGSEENRHNSYDPMSVSTSDAIIESTAEHASDWKTTPDTTVTFETMQSPESNPLYIVGVRKVITESDRSRTGEGHGETSDQSDSRCGRNRRDLPRKGGDERDQGSQEGPRVQRVWKKAVQEHPSMIKSLLTTSVIAGICGLAGALGYSYFSGSSHKSESRQRQSNRQSESAQHASLATSRRPSHQ